MAHAPVRIKDITRAPARTYIQEFLKNIFDPNMGTELCQKKVQRFV